MANRPRSDAPQDDLEREIDRLLKQLPMGDPKLRGDPEPPSAKTPTPTGGARNGTGVSGVAARTGTGVNGAGTAGNGVPAKIGTPGKGVAAREDAAAATSKRAAQPSLRIQHAAVWGRVALASGLGVAVAYWPYARTCGWSLYFYLFAVASVMISGAWASVSAWRMRIAPAHIIALIVGYWGIVLAAEQILPRIAYAAETAAWTCSR